MNIYIYELKSYNINKSIDNTLRIMDLLDLMFILIVLIFFWVGGIIFTTLNGLTIDTYIYFIFFSLLYVSFIYFFLSFFSFFLSFFQ